MTDKIIELLNDFKVKSLTNRAFIDCELLEVFKSNFVKLEIALKKDYITYRARAYKEPNYGPYAKYLINAHPANEKDLAENHDLELGELVGFCGYNKEDSFVNPNKYSVEEGRCNYKYSPCLYAAENERVAISELKPLIREVISVAKIKNKEDLKLLNLRLNQENEIINAIAKFFIQSPTLDNPDAYIYTQIISAYVRSFGYDGISYSSCQVYGGVNYAIFNYDKCEPISSKLCYVTNILIESEEIR